MTNETVRILNSDIHNITQNDLLNTLKKGIVVTPNIDHMMRLQKDEAFYQLYQKADYRVCDSRIIYLLCRLLFPSNALKEQITGSDFFPAFCQFHKNNLDTHIFLLGGSENSVVQAKDNINQKTGREIVSGYYSPPFGFEHSDEESRLIKEKIEAVTKCAIDYSVWLKWW